VLKENKSAIRIAHLRLPRIPTSKNVAAKRRRLRTQPRRVGFIPQHLLSDVGVDGTAHWHDHEGAVLRLRHPLGRWRRSPEASAAPLRKTALQRLLARRPVGYFREPVRTWRDRARPSSRGLQDGLGRACVEAPRTALPRGSIPPWSESYKLACSNDAPPTRLDTPGARRRRPRGAGLRGSPPTVTIASLWSAIAHILPVKVSQ